MKIKRNSLQPTSQIAEPAQVNHHLVCTHEDPREPSETLRMLQLNLAVGVHIYPNPKKYEARLDQEQSKSYQAFWHPKEVGEYAGNTALLF